MCLETWGGGPGLVDGLTAAVEGAGMEILYAPRAVELIVEKGAVRGVVAREGSDTFDIRARAVVLASGGFEANTEWRTRYLGPGWELARVRGSRFNSGDGIRMAQYLGAARWHMWHFHGAYGF